MFDIGFAELIIIAIVGLVVIGPDRLPEAIRTVAKFLGKAKRTYANLRRDLEREIGADEIRRELYNEALLEELKQTREQLNESINWNDNSDTSNEMTPLKKPSAGQEPSANKASPQRGKEPSANKQASTDKKPSANKKPSRINSQTQPKITRRTNLRPLTLTVPSSHERASRLISC